MNKSQNTQGPEGLVAAAKAGDPQAQFQLARAAFQQGNEDEFRHWIQQAASQNFPPALFRLGISRLSKTLSPEGVSEAKDMIKKSADLGFMNAIRGMMVLNARGTGELPNWQEALHWFSLALKMNEPRAYREAGLMFQEKAPGLADSLLRHSAAAGDHIAAYHLGCLMLQEGAKSIRGEALFWLSQAHAGGHVLAARELAPYQGQVPSPPEKPLPVLEWPVVEKAVYNIAEPLTTFPTKEFLQDPKVRIVEGVLDKWECDYLIGRSAPMMQPASTSQSLEQGEAGSDYRTNSGAKFWPMQQDLIISIVDRKIALASDAMVDYVEDLVVLHYKNDERYFPHCDSFLPELPEQAAEIDRKGQRIRTCLVYLNDDFEGGETHFLYPEKKIRCPAGTAVIFENVNEEGDADEHSVHEGLPVTSGQKWLASKWIRDKSQVLLG